MIHYLMKTRLVAKDLVKFSNGINNCLISQNITLYYF